MSEEHPPPAPHREACDSEPGARAEPLQELFSKDYASILRLARARLARERSPVSAMTLVHELYLNLSRRDDLTFGSRQQFLAYSSRAMRSLLVDMARDRLTKKRAGELLPLSYGADVADRSGAPEQILALNEALERLHKIDERLFRVAELRAILGMEVADVAAAMGLSEPTVKRDWQRAKAYLHEQLGAGDDRRGCA